MKVQEDRSQRIEDKRREKTWFLKTRETMNEWLNALNICTINIKWTIMKVTNEEKRKIAYAKLVNRFLYITS